MAQSRLEKLKVLEEQLRNGLAECEADKLAPLARQYRETLREIEEIEELEEDNDEIAEILSERKTARKAGPVR